MSFSDSEAAKVKKQIVMRYPFTFYEEVSRTLIIFKTFRGNRKILRALPVMDELLDYCNLDPISGKRVYEMGDDEKSVYDLIDVPEELVEKFKELYHGTDEEYDGVIGLKHLAPGSSIDDNLATVIIRKPMRFVEAYGDHPPEWIALVAGFAYKVTSQTPSGFPVTEMIPMVDVSAPEIQHTFTHEIPRTVWNVMFERMWHEIAPVCTRIERVIAATLSAKGYSEGTASSTDIQYAENASEESDDSLDLT